MTNLPPLLHTKACKACSLEIPIAATKCPHCHAWQTTAAEVIHHPVFLIAFAGVVLAALLLLVLTATRTPNSEHPGVGPLRMDGMGGEAAVKPPSR